MTERYAGSEVLQMAVEIEKKGKAFYDGVVRSVKDPKTQDIFQYLSDEEVKHEKLFKSMLGELEAKSDSPYDDTETTLYFRSLIDRKIFPGQDEGQEMKKEMGDPAFAIRIALSFEKDAILFFHELLNFTRPEGRAAVERVIEEEREHIRRILQLKEDLNV